MSELKLEDLHQILVSLEKKVDDQGRMLTKDHEFLYGNGDPKKGFIFQAETRFTALENERRLRGRLSWTAIAASFSAVAHGVWRYIVGGN